MMIKKYMVVCAHTNTALASIVNKWINDGWQPYGRPFFTPDSTHLMMQAMVMYE